MQFRKEDRSIFPENFVDIEGVCEPERDCDTLGDTRRDDILSEIEFLNARMMHGTRHALSKNPAEMNEAEGTGLCGAAQRNSISDLVKMGHRLPEVESVEKMLSSDVSDENRESERQEAVSGTGIAPYRIVNLISGSYRLPEIDDESFFR